MLYFFNMSFILSVPSITSGARHQEEAGLHLKDPSYVCSTWQRALFLKETRVNSSVFLQESFFSSSVVNESCCCATGLHLPLNLATLPACLSTVRVLNNQCITWKCSFVRSARRSRAFSFLIVLSTVTLPATIDIKSLHVFFFN